MYLSAPRADIDPRQLRVTSAIPSCRTPRPPSGTVERTTDQIAPDGLKSSVTVCSLQISGGGCAQGPLYRQPGPFKGFLHRNFSSLGTMHPCCSALESAESGSRISDARRSPLGPTYLRCSKAPIYEKGGFQDKETQFFACGTHVHSVPCSSGYRVSAVHLSGR